MSSNILNKEIKLPKLPRLPNNFAIQLTRVLLIVYSLLSLAYLIIFLNDFRKIDDPEGVDQLIFGPVVIVFGLLLLFGIVQDIYAAIIINKNRRKSWEHSLIGTILSSLSSVSLLWPIWGLSMFFGNFYAPIILIIWIFFTILLFFRITKLRKG